MQLAIQQNTHSHTIRILLLDEPSGRGKTGLTPFSTGLMVTTLRDNETNPSTLPMVSWTGEEHLPGGFREVDPVAMPGLYELAIPDALCTAGARRATLMVQCPGVRPLVIHIDLIAYDPYDGYRLGLDCLTRESRHEVIARAFREVVPEIAEEFRGKLRA